MFNNPFTKSGNWYKGAFHIHTTVSDGKLSPKESMKLYQRLGFDFMILSEHEKIVDYASLAPPGLLTIPGVEYEAGELYNGHRYHIVAIDIPADFQLKRVREFTSVQDTIDQITASGAEAVIAHPYWYGMMFSDLMKITDYLGIEVFNWGCEAGIGGGRGLSSPHWDQLLSSGRKIYGFSGDDTHYYSYDVAGGWIVVKSSDLTRENIMAAIRKGEFYSSSGPNIVDLDVSRGTIKVTCDPAKFINFVTMPTLGKRIDAKRKTPLKSCEVKIKQDLFFGGNPKGYIRIELEDLMGKRCWLNPIFLD
ncbi:MAG: CehA/McbA family metallohydrolase [Candidatus Bathyarchaeota archaeon]|nr:MAG: CehA/McbA family metallohydrolase [Candidatus Bathyarchaeota archaeon]